MKTKLIQLFTNLKLEETELIFDAVKRFRTETEFNIIVNGITIFFDETTYIEIYENNIGFRSKEGIVQTNYTTFSYEDVDHMEIKYNGNYHYF